MFYGFTFVEDVPGTDIASYVETCGKIQIAYDTGWFLAIVEDENAPMFRLMVPDVKLVHESSFNEFHRIIYNQLSDKIHTVTNGQTSSF